MWSDDSSFAKSMCFTGQTAMLFAAMLVAFVVARPAGVIIVILTLAAIEGVYLLWPVLWNRKHWKQRDQGFRYTVLSLLSAFGALCLVVALTIAAGATWLIHAYRWDRIATLFAVDQDGPRLTLPEFSSALFVAAGFLLIAVMALGLAYAFRPWVERADMEATAGLYRGFAPRSIVSDWLIHLVTWGTFLSVLAAASAVLFYHLLDWVHWDRSPSLWDLVTAYPVLPLALLADAAGLVMLRHLCTQQPWMPAVPGRENSKPPPKIMTIGAPVRFAFTGTLLTVAIATVIYPVHVVLLVSFGAFPGIIGGADIGLALERWANRQNEDDRTVAAIAAAINETGRMSADAPGDGLAQLLPELRKFSDNVVQNLNCTVHVSAGAINASERAAAPWLEVEDSWNFVRDDSTKRLEASLASNDSNSSDAEKDEAEENEKTAIPPVRFCVKVSCPSPVAWDTPEIVTLYSSHPSSGTEWLRYMFFDALTEGRASTPGGYCTADGRLAAAYQG